MDNVGIAGNISGALASISGVNIIDVTAFTGGASDPVGTDGLFF